MAPTGTATDGAPPENGGQPPEPLADVAEGESPWAAWAGRLLPLLGVALFAVALVFIHRALRNEHYHDILRYLSSVPRARVIGALALTGCSYLVLTRYDALAMRWLGRRLSPITVLVGAFVGYAFANTVGMAWVSGGSVRYRFYAGSGLSAGDIARIAGFCTLTLWLGFMLLAGLVFVFVPVPVPQSVGVPFHATAAAGGVMIGIGVAYLVLVTIARRPLRVGPWEIPMPGLKIGLLQALVGSLDWACAAGVLILLLPDGLPVSAIQVLAVFMLAQVVGVLSQVPGGLGVFEGIVLVMLRDAGVPAATLIGALAAFRVLYYLVPLCAAALVLAANEVFERRHLLQSIARGVAPWMPRLVAPVFAATTLMGGAILLFSGATPALHGRLAWLQDVLPLPVLELSHFIGSLAGAGLLLLARGLQRRLDAAYVLTVALLAGGIVASLLKGLDWEEATILGVMAAALLPCRRHFYRKASLFSDTWSLGWLLAVLVVLTCSVWLGFFAYKHVEYSSDLWWQFTFGQGDAPRFLRATVGAVGLVLVVGAARLLRPARAPKPITATPAQLERVRKAISHSPDSSANLALLGDKTFLFSESGQAFIMYAVERRSWVAMGSPVGPEEEHVELAWRFRELCDQHSAWPVFYEVRGSALPLFVDLGLSLQKLGEQARVHLPDFSLDGGERKHLRQVVRRVERDGASFEIVPREGVPALLPELREISDQWLADKATREKGFSLGYFDPAYLMEFPCAVVRHGGRIAAFANVWASGDTTELSLDLMRHRDDAPRDSMEYLFVQLMTWGREHGYEWFDLGMAPLSGLEDRSLAPLWGRVGARVFRHGENLYNFQGLRRYKEKFDPEWSPIYLASPGGLALPIVLTNIAALVSRGLRGVVSK